jgi:hypothetical protein
MRELTIMPAHRSGAALLMFRKEKLAKEYRVSSTLVRTRRKRARM